MKSVLRTLKKALAIGHSRRGDLLSRLGVVIALLFLFALGHNYAPLFSAGNLAGDKSGGDCIIPNETVTGVPLSPQISESKVLPGTTFKVSIAVGSPNAPVSELFGVAFELHYTASPYLRPVTPVQVQPGPFLQPDTYQFVRHEPENHVFYLAISRKRGAPGKSGYGEVLSLSFEIVEGAPPGSQVCFSLRNIAANDAAGRTIPLEPGPPACITVDEMEIEVIPNPFTPNNDGSNDEVEFKREGGIPPEWVIRIMDRAGRTVRVLTNGAKMWDGRNDQNRKVAPGAYLYTISDRTRLLQRGVIALVR